MPPYHVKVEVIPKLGTADPSAINKLRELKSSGIEGSQSVKSLLLSDVISFKLEAPDFESARVQSEEMCKQLLVNPVLATAGITITEIEV